MTELDHRQREKLLGALTPEQKHKLLQNDYFWMDRSGVDWPPREVSPRLARCTHDAQSDKTHAQIESRS